VRAEHAPYIWMISPSSFSRALVHVFGKSYFFSVHGPASRAQFVEPLSDETNLDQSFPVLVSRTKTLTPLLLEIWYLPTSSDDDRRIMPSTTAATIMQMPITKASVFLIFNSFPVLPNNV